MKETTRGLIGFCGALAVPIGIYLLGFGVSANGSGGFYPTYILFGVLIIFIGLALFSKHRKSLGSGGIGLSVKVFAIVSLGIALLVLIITVIMLTR